MWNINPDHIIWLIVAGLNTYTAWIAHRTHEVTTAVAEKVEIIKVETNSMKDALVATTDKAARAEGREAGRLQEIEDRAHKL